MPNLFTYNDCKVSRLVFLDLHSPHTPETTTTIRVATHLGVLITPRPRTHKATQVTPTTPTTLCVVHSFLI